MENETISRPTQTQLFYCCAAQMCFHRQTVCVCDHIEQRVTPPPAQPSCPNEKLWQCKLMHKILLISPHLYVGVAHS